METRKRTTISLPDFLLGSLKAEAKRKNRSLNSIVEEKLMETVEFEPNEETLEAMRECESGMVMEELTPYNIEHLEEYINGL